MDAQLAAASYDQPVRITLLIGKPPEERLLPTPEIISKIGHLETLQDLLFVIRMYKHADGMPLFTEKAGWDLINDIMTITVGIQTSTNTVLTQRQFDIYPRTRVGLKLWETATIERILTYRNEGVVLFAPLVVVNLKKDRGDFFAAFFQERTRRWEQQQPQPQEPQQQESQQQEPQQNPITVRFVKPRVSGGPP